MRTNRTVQDAFRTSVIERNKAQEYADNNGISKSTLYRLAVAEFIRKHKGGI